MVRVVDFTNFLEILGRGSSPICSITQALVVQKTPEQSHYENLTTLENSIRFRWRFLFFISCFINT